MSLKRNSDALRTPDRYISPRPVDRPILSWNRMGIGVVGESGSDGPRDIGRGCFAKSYFFVFSAGDGWVD